MAFTRLQPPQAFFSGEISPLARLKTSGIMDTAATKVQTAAPVAVSAHRIRNRLTVMTATNP
jgi:hypothetical protein